jgi:predicted RecB family nuclease
MHACNWEIANLPGLSQPDREKLQACGITTTGQLLAETRTPASKLAIAGQLHFHPQHLSKWIALADLARLPSVGCQYCGVLLHSGIASVSQLAQTPVHRLHRQIVRMEVATMQRQDGCPPVDVVQRWVKEAQSLAPQLR